MHLTIFDYDDPAAPVVNNGAWFGFPGSGGVAGTQGHADALLVPRSAVAASGEGVLPQIAWGRVKIGTGVGGALAAQR